MVLLKCSRWYWAISPAAMGHIYFILWHLNKLTTTADLRQVSQSFKLNSKICGTKYGGVLLQLLSLNHSAQSRGTGRCILCNTDSSQSAIRPQVFLPHSCWRIRMRPTWRHLLQMAELSTVQVIFDTWKEGSKHFNCHKGTTGRTLNSNTTMQVQPMELPPCVYILEMSKWDVPIQSRNIGMGHCTVLDPKSCKMSILVLAIIYNLCRYAYFLTWQSAWLLGAIKKTWKVWEERNF